MRVTWHGHSCYHIDTAQGKSVLVDPFLANGKTAKQVADFAPDFVLLTHGHADHTGAVLEFRDAHVVSNFEIGLWLQEHGVTERTGMNIGGTVRPVAGVRVFMTPAQHSSGLEAVPLAGGTIANGGSPCGFIVDDGETKLYIAGDTGLFGDMKHVLRDVMKPDVAALPIGDLFTMGAEHAAIAAQWLGVKVATPCHYGTFPPIAVDPQVFVDGVGDAARVEVPDVDGDFEVRGGKVQ